LAAFERRENVLALVLLATLTSDAGPGDVAKAQAGDRAAFGRLFERYGRLVHGVLLARVQRADADDLMHDVFMHALSRLDTLQNAQSVGAWLTAMARNRVADLKRKPELVQLPPDLAVLDPRRAEANQVLAVIRSLPEAYRETLVLRLVEGMSGKEIAEETGLTAESVRVNLHRGMKQLRERLGLRPVEGGEP
jgi:RNA polymerase sigma-70 factor (ECF subfamily)